MRERTLLIESAVALGEVGPTKTRQTRTVKLLRSLAQDLARWRLLCGRPSDDALVFPGQRGRPWSLTEYQNWRRRIYAPTAQACGVKRPRPYDLRHSFVSLLIQEGMSVIEVARQAGHAPTMTLATYAHVFDELDPQDRRPAEEQIRLARGEHVPVSYPRADAEENADTNSLQTPHGRCWARTSDLLLVSCARSVAVCGRL